MSITGGQDIGRALKRRGPLMGVLTRIDGNALSRYCRLWTRWRKAEAFIEQNGDIYPLKDERGKVKCFQQFPQVLIATKLAQQLTRLERSSA